VLWIDKCGLYESSVGSRCCLKIPAHLQLVASPIPDPVLSYEIKVSQGELFAFETTTGEILPKLQSGFTNKFNFGHHPACTGMFVEPGTEKVNCLVKVHCTSVHNASISPSVSWQVLARLASGNSKLKQELSKVLLAFMCIPPRWHVTVMRNLSQQVPSFHLLSHTRFPRSPALWAAFTELVENVLLPMADIGIVHTDIRFSHKHNTTYNILGSRKSDDTIVLRLIDLESLVNYDASLTSGKPRGYAVSPGHFSAVVPHEFLFWQVLWMAYVWIPPRGIGFPVEARDFIDDLFSGTSEFSRFKGWVGSMNMQSLWQLGRRARRNDGNAITEALSIFTSAFNGQHSPSSCANM
jgi:hypothetical protein